jgi:hypothetical protein
MIYVNETLVCFSLNMESELSALDNTVADLEMLKNSPSRKQGFSSSSERDIRIRATLYLRKAGIILRLPAHVAATAQVLMQRFYCVVSVGVIPLIDLAGGCLYLASKLEETPKRLSSIIVALDYLRKREEGLPDSRLAVGGSDYFDYREGVLQAELTVLAKLGFNVHVEHPHGYLLNYISAMELNEIPNFAQDAIDYLNDRLSFS